MQFFVAGLQNKITIALMELTQAVLIQFTILITIYYNTQKSLSGRLSLP